MNKDDFQFLQATINAVFNANRKILIVDKNKNNDDTIIKFKNGSEIKIVKSQGMTRGNRTKIVDFL